MYSVVPEGQLARNSQHKERLLEVQSKLVQHTLSNQLKQFNYAVNQAEQIPSLTEVASNEQEDYWTITTSRRVSENIAVRGKLASFLPKPAMDLIESGVVSDLQGIMDDRNVPVTSFLTVFSGTRSADKCFQEFGFVRIPDWDEPLIEIYYVRLEAHFESHRYFLWMHEDKNTLSAEFKMKRYQLQIIPETPHISYVYQNPHRTRKSCIYNPINFIHIIILLYIIIYSIYS